MDKYRYVFKHKVTGEIKTVIRSLGIIEMCGMQTAIALMKEDGCDLISRDRFIGIHDDNDAELYENTKVKLAESGIVAAIKIEYGLIILVSDDFEDGFEWAKERVKTVDGYAWIDCEVVGTIYDDN